MFEILLGNKIYENKRCEYAFAIEQGVTVSTKVWEFVDNFLIIVINWYIVARTIKQGMREMLKFHWIFFLAVAFVAYVLQIVVF